jgi:hypothetical protein
MATEITIGPSYQNVINPSNLVLVKVKSDFPAPVTGVITLLADVTYFITAHIDLLGDTLAGSSNTTLMGGSSENCSITSTGLGVGVPLFTSDWTTPMRNFAFRDVDTAVRINGNTNLVALDWTGVNFVNIPNAGVIDNVSNFIFNSGAFLNSKGLLFTGTINTVGIGNSLFSGDGAAGSMIELDALCVITRRFRVIYSSMVAFALTSAINVDASTTIPAEGFILDNINFSGGGVYLSGLDQVSNKALFTRCVGIVNTAVNGQMYMHDNAVATTIAVVDTFYKAAGVTLGSIDNQRYTETDNRLTNNSTIERKYLISCSLSFNAGNNNVCEFGFYDSKLGTVREPSKTKATANAAGRAESVSFTCVVQHSENDYIEIWCANGSGTTDIIVTDMNTVIVEIK